jgi:hypothetical protein
MRAKCLLASCGRCINIFMNYKYIFYGCVNHFYKGRLTYERNNSFCPLLNKRAHPEQSLFFVRYILTGMFGPVVNSYSHG